MPVNEIIQIVEHFGIMAGVFVVVVYFLLKQKPTIQDRPKADAFSSSQKLYLRENVVDPIIAAVDRIVDNKEK